MRQYVPAVVAILCIALLEVIAIASGINGTALAGAIAAIAGLGGYQVAKARIKK